MADVKDLHGNGHLKMSGLASWLSAEDADHVGQRGNEVRNQTLFVLALLKAATTEIPFLGYQRRLTALIMRPGQRH